MRLSDLTSRLRGRTSTGDNDLGFGRKIGASGERLINSDGSYNVVRTGAHAFTPYQYLVEMSWSRFSLLILAFYIGVNALFAFLFQIIGVENLSGVSSGHFLEDFAYAFFFSVQTFTTVGYGSISPEGIAANLLASMDALVGLLSLALATGLVFARFSKPRAQILFSDRMLYSPYLDSELFSLQFRIANLRNNKIINLKATVVLSWTECIDNRKQRRFTPLHLERDAVKLFPLNWTIVHILDADSPLADWTKQDFIERQAEAIVLIEGYDESYAQNVHMTASYDIEQFVWHARFINMYKAEKGVTYLNLNCISKFDYLPGYGQEEEE